MEKKYQVFISSTYEDLKEERKKVQDTILGMYVEMSLGEKRIYEYWNRLCIKKCA